MIVFAVDDAMVEAWFSRQVESFDDLSEAMLSDIAPWLSVIGIIANDNAAQPHGMPTVSTSS